MKVIIEYRKNFGFGSDVESTIRTTFAHISNKINITGIKVSKNSDGPYIEPLDSFSNWGSVGDNGIRLRKLIYCCSFRKNKLRSGSEQRFLESFERSY